MISSVLILANCCANICCDSFSSFSPIRSVPTETANAYAKLGLVEHNKGEFQNALSLFTEGIDVKYKDDQVNFRLYMARFLSHSSLGESVICCPLELSKLK